MQFSITNILSFVAFGAFAVSNVVASPVAAPVAAADVLAPRAVAYQEVEVVLTELYTNVKATNLQYATICRGSCSPAYISTWSGLIAGHCNLAVTKCNLIPKGHKNPNRNGCISLVGNILFEINVTLNLLLSTRGVLGSLLVSVANLISVLTFSVQGLLVCLVPLVDGLLISVGGLLTGLLGGVGCLLCSLGGLGLNIL